MRFIFELQKGVNMFQFCVPIKLREGTFRLNRAHVKWTMYNVKDGEVVLDNTKHDVPTGYYTFDDLKKVLEDLQCTVTLLPSGKCEITPPHNLNLKNIGALLGFNKDHTFSSKTISPYLVQIHHGLDWISIYSDQVNEFQNYQDKDRSKKVVQLLCPAGNLFGTTSSYSLNKTEVPWEKQEFHRLVFNVNDESSVTDKDSYTIMLDGELL